jgi:hypothetical protein
VIKSRRLRWEELVARIGRVEVHTGFKWGNLSRGNHLEYSGIDGRIILKWNSEKWDGGGARTESIWLRIWTCGGLS